MTHGGVDNLGHLVQSPLEELPHPGRLARLYRLHIDGVGVECVHVTPTEIRSKLTDNIVNIHTGARGVFAPADKLLRLQPGLQQVPRVVPDQRHARAVARAALVRSLGGGDARRAASCSGRYQLLLVLRIVTLPGNRAVNEPSRSFIMLGEGSYLGLLSQVCFVRIFVDMCPNVSMPV